MCYCNNSEALVWNEAIIMVKLSFTIIKMAAVADSNDLTSNWRKIRLKAISLPALLSILILLLPQPQNAMPIPKIQQNSLTSAMVRVYLPKSFWFKYESVNSNVKKSERNRLESRNLYHSYRDDLKLEKAWWSWVRLELPHLFFITSFFFWRPDL